MGDRSARKFKVVLLGEGRVGKTSILLRYIKGEYDEKQVSTLQASYLDKRLVVDNARVQLSLWDTAGQERFHALGPIYYRDADGALLVYDITDEESFRKVRAWVRELRRIVGDDIDICIAGNKVDLHRGRKVEEEDAARYAASVGATHFHTSAKLNRGLEDVFVDLTKRMLARKGSKKKKSALIADDEPLPPPPRSNYQQQMQQQQQQQQQPTARTRQAPASGGATGPGRGGGGRHPAALPGEDEVVRNRDGGRGQAPQIVDDDEDAAPFRPSSSGLRVRGATNADAAKAKGGCC